MFERIIRGTYKALPEEIEQARKDAIEKKMDPNAAEQALLRKIEMANARRQENTPDIGVSRPPNKEAVDALKAVIEAAMEEHKKAA